MPTPRAQRLSRNDWLIAGMRALPQAGGDGLKAEPLARHLGTTKGSFYWHFRDVPAFHEALLALWEEAALAALDGVSGGTPTSRLRGVAQAIAAPTPGDDALAAEPAIRGWARSNSAARDSVARVDAARLGHLRALLSETGIDNPEMARIIHAAAIGMTEAALSDDVDRRAAIGSLVDLVLALR